MPYPDYLSLPWARRPNPLISDAGGFTGQGALLDTDMPDLATPVAPGSPVGLAPVRPSPLDLPPAPRLTAAQSPAIGAAEDVLRGLPSLPSPQVQQRAAQAPSAWRSALATLAGTFTPSAGFAPLIAYGPQGLQARKEVAAYQQSLPTRLSAANTIQNAQDDDALRIGQMENRQIRQEQNEATAHQRGVDSYGRQTNSIRARSGRPLGALDPIPEGYNVESIATPEGGQERWAIPSIQTVANVKNNLQPVPEPLRKEFGLPEQLPSAEIVRYTDMSTKKVQNAANLKAREDVVERQIAATDARSAAGRALQLQLAHIRTQKAAAKAGISESDQALVNAVLDNPAALDTLTPSARTRITPLLYRQGFRDFGKALSDADITKVSDSRFALASLQDLQEVLEDNRDKLGPISGMEALNPYSDKKILQAKVDLVKQRVGKALEGGVLRREDEIKYGKILAGITDTDTNAIEKTRQLAADVENSMKIYLQTLGQAGRRVGGLTPQAAPPAPAPGKIVKWGKDAQGNPVRITQ